ncbi:MAG: phytanoyl-CoA dioxygenase family protein, partial [Boseongicola sp.]|nr:phytanoyl-CoA dioxygenase family protein [Boseongicola sp.]
YDAATLAKHFSEPDLRRELLAEWAHILHSSAGVFAIRNAQPDLDAIDQATAAYEGIIAREKETLEAADHFAAAGSNDRIWNSLQKLAETAPEVYVRYFASPAIDAASEAWLGPNYQMTAQINLVHPGGKAQRMHRDYHLGFQTAELSATYPAHVHDLSPLMTLQGGLAHCDVPIASGSTKLLPFSQMYRPGYAAWRRDDYQAYFEENFAQLPLQKGDAVFFNPALFHAAGDNTTKDVHRMVNLFQVSSAFGRSLENVNRRRMCEAVYDALALAWNDKTMSEAELDAVLGSTAEGYPFPTNLDTDPPVGGLAPKSQKELMKDAILAGSDKSEFVAILDDLAARQSA